MSLLEPIAEETIVHVSEPSLNVDYQELTPEKKCDYTLSCLNLLIVFAGVGFFVYIVIKILES